MLRSVHVSVGEHEPLGLVVVRAVAVGAAVGPVVSILGPSWPLAPPVVSRLVVGAAQVDSRITLRDGSTYDVRWLLSKYGSTYRAFVFGECIADPGTDSGCAETD